MIKINWEIARLFPERINIPDLGDAVRMEINVSRKTGDTIAYYDHIVPQSAGVNFVTEFMVTMDGKNVVILKRWPTYRRYKD